MQEAEFLTLIITSAVGLISLTLGSFITHLFHIASQKRSETRLQKQKEDYEARELEREKDSLVKASLMDGVHQFALDQNKQIIDKHLIDEKEREQLTRLFIITLLFLIMFIVLILYGDAIALASADEDTVSAIAIVFALLVAIRAWYTSSVKNMYSQIM